MVSENVQSSFKMFTHADILPAAARVGRYNGTSSPEVEEIIPGAEDGQV